jgi:hypothetical protein
MSGASDTMLGRVLETVVGDPERALTIANTSMASAMSVSTRETYQEFGLAKMRWLALEPCNTCAGNGAMGPVTPGEAVFKNVQGDNITEPPAHPNCRCALSPVIDLDQFKYSNSQTRDDRGRWSSSGGGSALDRLQNSQVSNGAFVSSITEEETKALIKYKGSDFAGINMMLRQGNIPPELASMQKRVDNLDSLIDKAPPVAETFTTHRVITGSQFAASVEGLERGWSFKDPAFTSTTADKSHAESRVRIADSSGEKAVMMNIIVQKGQKGLFVEPLTKGKVGSSILGEAEFLLPRNSVFTKIGNNPNGSVDMVVELD